MSRMRRLASLLLVALVVAGCGAQNLRQATSGGNAFGTFLAGISAENMDGEGGYLSWWRTGGGGSWRTPTDWVPVILDARCPLKIATRYYAASAESLPTGVAAGTPSPKLFAGDVGNYGGNGFYSTARMETLLVLQGPESPAGAALNGGGASPEQQAYDCSDKNRRQGYLPVRIDLRTGAYIVEGWVNPAATVAVSVETLESAKIKADASGQWDADGQSGAVYSPLRLNRFTITPNNLGRVLDFATLNKTQASEATARRIHWFRVSDLAPYYTELAPGNCPGLAVGYAFYESFDLFKAASCKPSDEPLPIGRTRDGNQIDPNNIDADLYIDGMARMGGAGSVESYSGDDRQCSATQGDCRAPQGGSGASGGGGYLPTNPTTPTTPACDPALPPSVPGSCSSQGGGGSGTSAAANDWSEIAKQLAILAATATSSRNAGLGTVCERSFGTNADTRDTCAAGSVEQKRWDAYRAIVNIYNKAGASFDLQDGISSPGDLITGGMLQTDVVGVIAGHGQKGWNDLKDVTYNGPATKRFGPFIGAGSLQSSSTALVSPSFFITSVGGGTAEQQAWLEKNSALFGGDSAVAPLMPFRTSMPDGQRLPYRQGALARLSIRVGGATIGANAGSVYTTDYLDLSIVGRQGKKGVVETTSYAAWDPAGWIASINNFIVDVYQGTFGAAMSSLSSFAVNGLATLPVLTKYELDGSWTDAVASSSSAVRKVYLLNERVNKSIFNGASAATITAQITNLPDEEQFCTWAAANGKLNPPDVDHAQIDEGYVYPADGDPVRDQHYVSECYVRSPIYGLFEISRGISLIAFLFLVTLFFFKLGTGRAKDMTITGFGARAVIALAVIFGMSGILSLAAAIVSEVVTLTNYFGTVLSGGKPYSYLWLFGAYLSQPDISAVNVFSLIMLAPFSLVGLLVLGIVNFLRSIVTIGVLALAPLWVISLLYKAESRFFERSLIVLLRVYLIPLFTLITLMVLFLFFPLSTDLTTSNAEFGILGAVLGLLAMLLVVIIPFFLSNYIIRNYGERVVGAVNGALRAATQSRRADFLEAGMRGAALGSGNSDLYSADTNRAFMENVRGSLGGGSGGGGTGSSERGEPGGRSRGGGRTGLGGGRGAGLESGESGAPTLAGGTKALSLGAGGAKAAIAAERGRVAGLFSRLGAAKSGLAGGGVKGLLTSARSGAAKATLKGVGVGGRLMKWSAGYATEQLVGGEYRATKGYASARLSEATAKLISAGAAIGAVNADGSANLQTATGRLYATGLGIAAATRDEVKGYANEKLSIARSSFTLGVDAERQYLAAETTLSELGRSLEETRSERESFDAAIKAGSYGPERSPEQKRALEQLATLDARIVATERDMEGARGVRVTAAAAMAAAAESSTASLGSRLYALRDSTAGNEIFGASEAAHARNEADANAAAAEAVIRRTNEEIAALEIERGRLELAGDRSGASRVGAMIGSKASLRDEVLVEQEAHRNDATRRRMGGEAIAELQTSEASRAAMAAMGRAGSVRARQVVTESTARLEAVTTRLAEVDAADRQHRAAVAAGTISGPSPYEDELRRLSEERAAEQARAAAAERVLAEARAARAIAQTWQRASSGRLPDGARIEVGFAGAAAAAAGAVAAASVLAGAPPISAPLPPQERERSAQAAEVSRRLDETLGRLGVPLPTTVDEPPAPVRRAAPVAPARTESEPPLPPPPAPRPATQTETGTSPAAPSPSSPRPSETGRRAEATGPAAPSVTSTSGPLPTTPVAPPPARPRPAITVTLPSTPTATPATPAAAVNRPTPVRAAAAPIPGAGAIGDLIDWFGTTYARRIDERVAPKADAASPTSFDLHIPEKLLAVRRQSRSADSKLGNMIGALAVKLAQRRFGEGAATYFRGRFVGSSEPLPEPTPSAIENGKQYIVHRVDSTAVVAEIGRIYPESGEFDYVAYEALRRNPPRLPDDAPTESADVDLVYRDEGGKIRVFEQKTSGQLDVKNLHRNLAKLLCLAIFAGEQAEPISAVTKEQPKGGKTDPALPVTYLGPVEFWSALLPAGMRYEDFDALIRQASQSTPDPLD